VAGVSGLGSMTTTMAGAATAIPITQPLVMQASIRSGTDVRQQRGQSSAATDIGPARDPRGADCF